MLSPYEVQVISAVADTVSALSMIGSLFIIFSYIAFPSIRSFSFKLVFSLAITDFMNQFMGYIGPSDIDMADMNRGLKPISDICYFQAITESYFNLASIAWVSVIALTLYRLVIRRISQTTVEKSYLAYALGCWIIPAVLTALPAIDRAYGPAGGWCWIIDEKAYWRFAQFYGPLWLVAIGITYMYIHVILVLHSILMRSGGYGINSVGDMIGRLKWYPLILFFVWIWASANRIYETAVPGHELFWLVLLQRMFSNSQGLLNAIAYGINISVKEAIWNSIPERFQNKLIWCLPRDHPRNIFRIHDVDTSVGIGTIVIPSVD